MRTIHKIALLLIVSACASTPPKPIAFNPADGTYLEPPSRPSLFSRIVAGVLGTVGTVAGGAGKGVMAYTPPPKSSTYNCTSNGAGLGATCTPQ